MKPHKLLIILIFLYSPFLDAQEVKQDYWRIDLTDKLFNKYDTANPQLFLTQKAIERRVKNNVNINIEDLPITQMYIDSICAQNITCLHTSKWLNSIVVIADSNEMVNLYNYSFVKNIVKLHSKIIYKTNNENPKNKNFKEIINPDKNQIYNPQNNIPGNNTKNTNAINSKYDYGYAYNQIDVVKGTTLHSKGYTAKNITIAVLDAGFNKIQDISFFDNVILNNRIIAVKDYVNNNVFDFSGSTHGTQVLSIMAAQKNYLYIGTAPDANYILLKTEDTRSESPLEEENWISAIEFADSIGADIVNSSLGYNTFDNPKYNHTYQETDGKTARISIAANKATSKGMIVVNSAGNSGDKTWGYIGFPADAQGVLTVGATDLQLKKAPFSSYGPTIDNRTKPDIVAPGASIAIINHNGTHAVASGTSFAAPIVTGLTACLIQAFPQKNANEIINAIKKTASQYVAPDNYYGYGTPDFYSAYIMLSNKTEDDINVFPNPFTEDINIIYNSNKEKHIDVLIYNYMGQLVVKKEKLKVNKTTNTYLLKKEIKNLKQGIYYIIIKDENTKFSKCLLKG